MKLRKIASAALLACLGTGSPPVFQGQAGAGTLVTFGSEETNCRDVLLQFDTGRGTTQQLSKIGVPAGRISAVFFTHIHSDHSEGFADLMQLRWHFNSGGPKVDLVCHEDTKAFAGHTMSCTNFAAHIGDALIQSGEMAQRLAENPKRLPGGPADLLNVSTFGPSQEPQVIWESGEVSVSPVMGPDGTTGFPPPIFFRQSTATDLGSMAARAGVTNLMYTHLIPPMGAPRQGPYKLPAPLTEADYEGSARDGGFEGNVVVGSDLAKLRLTAQ